MSLSAAERKLLMNQQARASALEDTHLTCRLFGHSWSPRRPDESPPIGELYVVQCDRCKMVRKDVFSPKWGELLDRAYQAPPGYYVKVPATGERSFSAAALRSEWVKRRATLSPATLPTIDREAWAA